MDPPRIDLRLAGLIGPRGRNVLHVASWSLVAKIATAANLFLPIPFVIGALGPARFGVWATLVSFTTLAGFLDFGFGNGTMNVVAAAHGRGSASELAAAVREGRRTLLLVATVLAVLALAALPLVPWHSLLGLPVAMEDTCRAGFAVVLLAIVAAIPLNLANRVQLGLGRGDRTFRWQAFGQLFSLALVLLLAQMHASLPALTAAAVVAPLAGPVVNTILLARDPILRQQRSSPRHPVLARQIRHEGVLFFVLQMSAALASSVDLPLISALRGPTDAGTYAIVQRLFSTIPLALGLAWTPLWPIYRRALAKGDHAWVSRTLSRSMLVAISIAAPAALVFFACFDLITRTWIHHPLAVAPMLVAGFALWSVLDAVGSAIGTFFNAASMLRFQVTVAILFATTCFAAKVVVITRVGVAAVPWAAVATYGAVSLLPTWFLWPKLERAVFAKSY